ncbi:ribose ABC transporter [Mesorhizobium sp. LSJC285A00]|nr:ribose ABC transporter [Mesorhizobium sp. LSJC285A00]
MMLATLLGVAGVLAGGTILAGAQDGPAGLTKPAVFAPFDPKAPACSPPPGLNKVLAFAQDNEREFMQGVDRGLAAAAKDRGLGYRRALANNDAAKGVEQVQLFLASKIGGLVAAPVDPASMSRSLQELIWSGAYVGTIVPPPATSLLNAPQYETGKVLAEAAAAYIKDKLGGKANVVILSHDSMEFLAPRFAAMRDIFKAMPDVTIVADISPNPVNKEGGFATMSTILQAHPDVDVVLGADTVVLGALAALEAAGKARPDQFLGGIDGEPEAVAAIKKGGGPYKASIQPGVASLRLCHGPARGRLAGGQEHPAGDGYPARGADQRLHGPVRGRCRRPGRGLQGPKRRDIYLRMYGNICYDTRDQYVNFPWSSEAK